MGKEKNTYQGRVPEQFATYSPIENPVMPDVESRFPRDIGSSKGYDQRELHTRRDNDSKFQNNFHRTLTQATEALIYFIDNTVKPTIVVNDKIVPIPVIFANGEKWASVQKFGFMKDEKGKTLAPVIAVRRTGIELDPDLAKLYGIRSYGNEISFYTNYSSVNRYDKFSILNNQKPLKEIYSVQIPDWFNVTFDIIIWTEMVEQIDKLIEDFYYFRGVPAGKPNSYKFRNDITGVSAPETTNSQQEDRLVKTTLNIEMKVPIVQDAVSGDENVKKELTIGKILFNNESVR